jgi:hypothetical protein
MAAAKAFLPDRDISVFAPAVGAHTQECGEGKQSCSGLQIRL